MRMVRYLLLFLAVFACEDNAKNYRNTGSLPTDDIEEIPGYLSKTVATDQDTIVESEESKVTVPAGAVSSTDYTVRIRRLLSDQIQDTATVELAVKFETDALEVQVVDAANEVIDPGLVLKNLQIEKRVNPPQNQSNLKALVAVPKGDAKHSVRYIEGADIQLNDAPATELRLTGMKVAKFEFRETHAVILLVEAETLPGLEVISYTSASSSTAGSSGTGGSTSTSSTSSSTGGTGTSTSTIGTTSGSTSGSSTSGSTSGSSTSGGGSTEHLLWSAGAIGTTELQNGLIEWDEMCTNSATSFSIATQGTVKALVARPDAVSISGRVKNCDNDTIAADSAAFWGTWTSGPCSVENLSQGPASGYFIVGLKSDGSAGDGTCENWSTQTGPAIYHTWNLVTVPPYRQADSNRNCADNDSPHLLCIDNQ